MLGDKPIVEHVIDTCKRAATFIEGMPGHDVACSVALLIPHGDPLLKYEKSLPVIQGPEDDVLKRYATAAEQSYPDYIVRITADCPLLPEFVITSMVKYSLRGGYDYVTNIIPEFRTAIDGHDCEVLSHKLLSYLDKTAVDAEDREHVTTFLGKHAPLWMRLYGVIGYYDLSHIKLSVDTEEDLVAVRKQYAAVERKLEIARRAGIHVGRL